MRVMFKVVVLAAVFMGTAAQGRRCFTATRESWS